MQLRVNARAPELGSTRAEIELSCSQQEGSLSITAGSNGAIVVVCQLGAQPLFSGMEFEGRLMGSTVLLERADFAAIRRELESRYGAARELGVDQDGFRIFSWDVGPNGVAISMYRTGVRFSWYQRLPDDATQQAR